MDPVDDLRLGTQADAALERLRVALDAAGVETGAAETLIRRLAHRAPSAAAGAGPVAAEVAALLAAAELSATKDRLAAAAEQAQHLLRVVADSRRAGG